MATRASGIIDPVILDIRIIDAVVPLQRDLPIRGMTRTHEAKEEE